MTLRENLKTIYTSLKSKKEFKKAVSNVTGLETDTLDNYFTKNFKSVPDYVIEKSIPIAQNQLKIQYEKDRKAYIESLEVEKPETVKS